jgi:SAM-dependent methyltransferase
MKKHQWTKSVASKWGLFLPPARPSLSELAVIEKYLLGVISSKKKAKIAILGSTTEYRDLCQTNNADYRCIDYKAHNFKVLNQFMLHKDNNANLIVSDWRNMKFKGKFDLFIGDLVTTVTPVKDHEKIFKNIKKHCNNGAKIILKVPLRENNKQLTHKQIFQHYRKNFAYLNPFAAVWNEVLIADYDFKEDTMHCPTSLRKLRESFKKGIINEYEFNEFKKRWLALGDFKMNIPLKKEYLKKVSKYFKVEKITSGIDWYRKWAPILILSA